MTDVFLAFAAADAERVAPIARALQSRGFNVYQGADMADPSTGAQLTAAKAVIIVWSTASTTGDWPALAADSGKDREILAPIFIDAVNPRVGYGQFQGENLAAYPAPPADAAFERLVTQLEAMRVAGKAQAPAAPQSLYTRTPARGGVGNFLLPGAIALLALAGAYQMLQKPKEPTPAPTKEQSAGDLGADERYGLSPADLAALDPHDLIVTALKKSRFDAIEASASEDALSGTLLCLADYYGEGTARNAKAAGEICAKASREGSALATYVGSLAARDAGDPAGADALLQQAAKAGDARAQHDLALSLRASAPAKARDLAEKCAAQGHDGCRFLLAQMQIAGEGGPRDAVAGRQALDALDQAFYAPAVVELGKMFRDGTGGAAPDLDEAIVRFQRAAVLGDGEANYLLGQMAEAGKGMPKDAAKAKSYYAAAAAAGYMAPASPK